MTSETWWIATGIFILAFALVVAGTWLKSGPEWAMIIAGGMLAWFASSAFRLKDSDADND